MSRLARWALSAILLIGLATSPLWALDLHGGGLIGGGDGGGDALTSNPLSQFAATTSLQLFGTLTNPTGTGLAVFGTAPTFTTNITAPLVIGGGAAGSTLTLKSTGGVGTTDAIIFLVGSNGGTEAGRFITSGYLGLGGATVPIAPLQVGTGDALQMFHATTPTNVRIVRGTSASPDTTAAALVKIERTLSTITAAGDKSEESAGLFSIVSATAASDTQPVGVLGAARQASNSDAAGGYFNAKSTGTGFAIGVFAIGTTTAGKAVGMEIDVENSTGVAGTINTTGIQQSQLGWFNALGDADSSAGLVFGNAFGYQMEVGLLFNVQVAGGKTGPITSTGSTYRDLSSSAISLDIRGLHATAAIQVADASGGVGIGAAPSTDKLHVESASDVTFRVKKTAGSDFYINSGTSGTTVATVGSTTMSLSTANTERVRLGTTGQINFLSATGTNLWIFDTSGNGTLLGTAAKTIKMARNVTAATAGQGFTIDAGGAIASTDNLAGGDLTLTSGISTGTGGSQIVMKTAVVGVSGSTDNTPITQLLINTTGQVLVTALKTTGAATGKTVVCVDITTGQLYASTSGVACAN